MYSKYIKHFLDFIFAGILLLVFSPIIAGIALLLFFANRGKAFFFQTRIGKAGKAFRIVKFKTMNDRRNENGELLPDAERLTSVGRFVRKYSLDELPQLFNILTGSMSLIGPRPLLQEYLPLYNPVQAQRHNVKPGITGWAQINGRNSISWADKFALDVWYVNNISLGLDVKILFLTLGKTFGAKDINSSEQVTMDKFNGNN